MPSFRSAAKGPLELTATPLKMSGGDFNDYVLANVNRWRQQLGLPTTSKTKLFGPEMLRRTCRGPNG